MKKLLLIISTVFLTLTVPHEVTNAQSISDIPDVKIGNTFIKSNDYKIKDISKKNEYCYQYTKPIKTLGYGHSIDYLLVLVKNNVVIGYIFFLFPKVGEVGVPKQMIDRFKTETGFALGKSGNSYGAIIDNYRIIISRVNDISFGGAGDDRIMIITENVN